MSKLDEIAINIEFVLVSLIEGVALVTLAEQTEVLIDRADWLLFVPYVLSGLAILLVFWAQSILHAVSFIRWPIRIEHMLLYFVAAFLQILAYSSLTDITMWFFWWTIFSFVGLLVYWLDLQLIRDSRASFAKIQGGSDFIADVERQHLYDMKYLVPGALAFNGIVCTLAYFAPGLFSTPLSVALPGTLQFLITAGALYSCVQNFRERGVLLAQLHG